MVGRHSVTAETLVHATGLVKTYRRDAEEVHALDHVDLRLDRGEVVALVGPSGSGKSTLLNVLCGWEVPDSGALQWSAGVPDVPSEDLPWGELSIVPQALGLLDDLQARDNVQLPARMRGQIPQWRPEVDRLMGSFGIDHLALRLPNQMSLGEQQRCCVARALLLHPQLLLADEPTAHQDLGWAEVIFQTLRDLADSGSSCLVATHNPATWQYADRIVSMHDGRLRDGPPADHI